jgi:hypothetical protein
MRIAAGVHLTLLPREVVEEEIGQSPVANLDFRLGLPWNISLTSNFHTNYIVNSGGIGFQWSFAGNKFPLAVGSEANMWFGHVEFRAIQLKSWGLINTPYIIIGADFDDVLVSLRAEMHQSMLVTHDGDENYLGKQTDPFAGFAFEFVVEQPLWRDNWVSLGVKVNYSRFYYQSWLSYNTVKEYLTYPEFLFAFAL